MTTCGLRGARCLAGAAAVWALSAGAAEAQVSTIQGQTGDGALYAFSVPENWNRRLVVYVHGVVDPAAPVAVPTAQDGFNVLRDEWLAAGYAVAASSFSDNGYALKTAVQRTHQLRGLFVSQVGSPDRTYLLGHSLGGLAVLALAERYPGEYDAALPVCAPLGGGIAEMQYLGHARVLFDYFFPGVVPGGGAFSIPEGLAFTPGSPVFMATLNALTQGLFAPGQPTLQFARTAGLPFTSIPELISSAMSVVGFSVRFTNDVLDRTHGHVPFDNMDTIYSGSADDAALNAGVDRFQATPDAANYFERYFTPSGDLQIPTLTLHTRLDPVVPFWHEAAYAATAETAGAGAFLVQQAISRYGHCAVTPAETATAFAALVQWADGGAKPVGGDATIR